MDSEVVTKFDSAQVRRWLQDLRKVLPIIPSRDGLVLTRDDRPLFRFIMDSANGGLTPHEAYAFAGILENLVPVIDSVVSQQRDFVMVRRALMKVVSGTATPRQLDEIRLMIEDTAYIER